MKKLLVYLSLIALCLLPSCEPSRPDIPEPKPVTPVEPEEPSEPAEPQTPQEKTYPVDAVAVLQDAGLVGTIKSSTSYSPHRGVEVSEIRYTDYAGSPQAVFVMQVDLSDETVSITNTVPGGATTTFNKGRERLSEQFKRIDAPGSRVIGGTNTDFFTTDGTDAGRAQGIFWHNGKCLRNVFASEATRPRCFVYWGEDEKVHIEPSAQYPVVKAKISLTEAFSGGQFLVRGGELSGFLQDSVYGIHPRTMIGVSEDQLKIVLVVLDGRNSVLAVGMNYPDMQKIMKALGSHDAINLDGGGSSTFIVRSNDQFQIRNMPSDGSERAIGPGLAVIASD